MTFAHDDVVYSYLHALVVLHEGQNKIFLFLWVDEAVVNLVIPDHRFDVVNVEVQLKLRFKGKSPQNKRHEDEIIFP